MPLISHHEVACPKTLDEALALLAERGPEGWQPLAGGTDLMVGINANSEERSKWIDISSLREELSAIREEDGRVRVGGMATMTDLRASDLLRSACPMLGEAAATVGAIQIQNRATVAGNVVNASPAGDTLPVWLAVEASVELASAAGVREVAYVDFTPSYRTTERRADELVTAMLFPPLGRDMFALFRKIGTRSAQAISKMVFAGVRREAEGRHRGVRLAFGSVGPVPLRAATAEAAANGAPQTDETARSAAAALMNDLAPIDDIRSTADYRRATARNLTREFLAGRLGASLA